MKMQKTTIELMEIFMSLMRLEQNGYDFCDVNGTIFFSEDSTHESLFQYVEKDLSPMAIYLENYINKKMDIVTFELKDGDGSYYDLVNLNSFFAEAHPYYENKGHIVLLRAVCEYLYALVIEQTYNENDFSTSAIYSREWFYEIVEHLMPFLLEGDSRVLDDFYKEYEDLVINKNWNNDSPLLFYKTKCFYSEINKQNTVKKWLFWVLDISAPLINELTTSQRILLYGNIFNSLKTEPELEVSTYMSFNNPHLANPASYLRDEKMNEENYSFTLAHDLSNYHRDSVDIHPTALQELVNDIEEIKNCNLEGIYIEYEIGDLYQLLFLEITHMAEANVKIKKCKNCGIYFVVTNQNAEYCTRIMEGETKPCSMIGSKRTFEKKLKSDIPLQIYNRAYKTHFARVRNGIMSKSDFNLWCITAKENLKNTREGKMPVNDFEKWLKG